MAAGFAARRGLALQILHERTGKQHLAGPGRARDKERVGHLAAVGVVAQTALDMFLTRNFGEFHVLTDC